MLLCLCSQEAVLVIADRLRAAASGGSRLIAEMHKLFFSFLIADRQPSSAHGVGSERQHLLVQRYKAAGCAGRDSVHATQSCHC